MRSPALGLGPRGQPRAVGSVNYPAPGTIKETILTFGAEGTVTRQSVISGSPSSNCCGSSPLRPRAVLRASCLPGTVVPPGSADIPMSQMRLNNRAKATEQVGSRAGVNPRGVSPGKVVICCCEMDHHRV